MKKIKCLLLLLTFSFFLPSFVYAEECRPDGIKIDSIQLKDKSEYVEEITPATMEANKINLDLEMYEVGDYVEYQLKVSNTSNDSYYFDKDLLGVDSNYFDYTISYKDQNAIIKPNEKKEVILKVQYKKEIEKDKFYSGRYSDNNSFVVPLSTKQGIIDTLTNPKTGRAYILILFIALIAGFAFFITRRNKKISSFLLIIALIVIPSSVYAICKCNIEIDSNITISFAKPNPCTFDGELVQGAEYVNGQYTYRYGQEYSSSSWNNMDSEGWGVTLTDKDSTDDVTTKLCTSINDKPIVSMSAMFYNSRTSNIDLSSFDTSKVINMSAMFFGVQGVEEYDLTSFNTENVVNMTVMFQNNTSLKKIDLSTFDTKNVVSHPALFSGDNNLEEVNMDNWDFRKSGVSGAHFTSNTKLKKVSCKNLIVIFL